MKDFILKLLQEGREYLKIFADHPMLLVTLAGVFGTGLHLKQPSYMPKKEGDSK